MPPKPHSPSRTSERRSAGSACQISASHATPQASAKNSAQLCVYIIAARETAKPTSQRRGTRSESPSPRPGRANARRKQTIAIQPSRALSEYIRASCAYVVSHGFSAARTAAIHAVRVPNSSRPPHHATGTHSSAMRSDRTWVLCSPLPNAIIQRFSSM